MSVSECSGKFRDLSKAVEQIKHIHEKMRPDLQLEIAKLHPLSRQLFLIIFDFQRLLKRSAISLKVSSMTRNSSEAFR